MSAVLRPIAPVAVPVAVLFVLGALPPASARAAAEAPVCVADRVGSEDQRLDITVCFGLGDRSWADRLAAFNVGSPHRCGADGRAGEALGHNDGRAAWLGQGGELGLAFDHGEIADRPGPDIWVFERGGDKESVDILARSPDTEWVYVTRTGGGRSTIDLALDGNTKGGRFTELLLIDINPLEREAPCLPDTESESRFPGADVDAVGAAVCSITFDPGQLALFAVNEADLGAQARARLSPVVELLKNTDSVDVRVAGFADADGPDALNRALSAARAEAVRDFLLEALVDHLDHFNLSVETVAGGELGSTGDDPARKAANRRVEIKILPSGDNACPGGRALRPEG